MPALKAERSRRKAPLTGKLDEKKDFMFVVTDDQGASYQFSIDSSAKPEGYDDVAVGDSVTVTYTGALSEVDPLRAQSFLWRKLNNNHPLKITKSRNRARTAPIFCYHHSLGGFCWENQ